MQNITETLQEVDVLNVEIAATTEVQSTVCSDINQRVTAITGQVQKVVKNAETSTARTGELLLRAERQQQQESSFSV